MSTVVGHETSKKMSRDASSSVAIPALCSGMQQVPAAGKAPLPLVSQYPSTI
jgi:hypothetical protein